MSATTQVNSITEDSFPWWFPLLALVIPLPLYCWGLVLVVTPPVVVIHNNYTACVWVDDGTMSCEPASNTASNIKDTLPDVYYAPLPPPKDG